MFFKVYNEEIECGFVIARSIKELAEICGSSLKQARGAYYKKTFKLNGFEIINYS